MDHRWIAAMAVAGASLAAAPGAFAEDADYYRGGWRTDSGDPHVYQFVIKGERVTGIYCTYCADGTTLAPIEGTFDEDGGVDFTIRHLNLDGSADYQDRLHATLEDGRLIVTGTSGAPDGGAVNHVAIKDPRGPVPGFGPTPVFPPGTPPVPPIEFTGGGGGGGGGGAPYVAPGEWRQITADDVVGLWIGFGVGMDKQLFFIRKDGDGLFGMVCGRCDNPYTFGALDDFTIHGDTLEFDIVHEDWGERKIPFERRVFAHVSVNEMRFTTRRDDDPEDAPPGISSSLVGPIAIEATAGNVVGE